MEKELSISVIIPVYNDREVLQELYRRLKPVMDSQTDKYEIILVDDGSKDKSWEEIASLQREDSHIIGVKLSRNFGQQNAIAAGLDHATNDIIVLMDSDLQDRPEDIPVLINALISRQVSMAVAQWKFRKDTALKKILSSLSLIISNNITTLRIEPRLGIFRAIQRSLIDKLREYPENTATVTSLLYHIENKYCCVPLERDSRYAGESGYNLSKMLSLLFARIFSFSMFPIRLITYTGILLSAIGFFWGMVIVLHHISGNIPLNNSFIMLAVIVFLFGVNFFFLGILGEYIGRILSESKKRPKYIVESILSIKL